jgi:hypothetical protein
MSKASDLRVLFRTINDGLNQVESLPTPESVRIVQSLKKINEELCDYVIDLVRAYERLKSETHETRRELQTLD